MPKKKTKQKTPTHTKKPPTPPTHNKETSKSKTQTLNGLKRVEIKTRWEASSLFVKYINLMASKHAFPLSELFRKNFYAKAAWTSFCISSSENSKL